MPSPRWTGSKPRSKSCSPTPAIPAALRPSSTFSTSWPWLIGAGTDGWPPTAGLCERPLNRWSRCVLQPRRGTNLHPDPAAVPTLLIVHPATWPSFHAMFDAVLSGATDGRIEGVEVVTRPALVASPVDVMPAAAYLLGTPANLGYISGA